MESFAAYLLKSALWLTGFAVVYLLFLRNERFFRLKRIYLITGLVVSVIFPLITFHYKVDVPVSLMTVEGPVLSTPDLPSTTPDKSIDFLLIMMIIYISGVLFLACRILRHVGVMIKIILQEDPKEYNDVRLIRSGHVPVSFSFFNYVFINPDLENEEVKEILNHETVHVKQKHWFDLVLAEFLRTIQWINPFMWMYAEFIKINHEYLADEEALQHTENPGNYRATLINQMMASPVFSLTNSFNYFLSKKRFEMMRKITISPYRKMKILLVLPVCAIIFYAFSAPEYNYILQSADNDSDLTAPVFTKEVIRGIVINAENEPLAGANIVITGNYATVATDKSGRFTITDVPDDSFLVVSSAGYKTQFIKADPEEEMSVRLLRDQDYLKPSRLRSIMPTDTGENPLLIVDGIESEKKMTDIDVRTIESMTVLRDSPSIAKYGQKGKNGVILITSKKKNADIQTDKDVEPFIIVEQMPVYPGGDKALLQFIIDNTKYPDEAKARNITGRVIVRFCVDTQGNATQISVFQGVDPLLDAEAYRVISLLKGFEPGRQGGKAVPVWYMVPVSFGIDQAAAQSQARPPAPPAGSLLSQKTASGLDAYVIVDEMPMYPGGDAELLQFVAKNIKFPEEAKKAGIQGKVAVRFVVTTEGGVTDFEVLKGVDPLLDTEAVRVVSLLSGWKPGAIRGKPVNVFYTLPVTFLLK